MTNDHDITSAAETATMISKAVGGPVGLMTGMVSVAAPIIAGAPAPANGGGFKFSAEELDTIIQEWEDLHEILTFDEYQARAMAQLQPPGQEFASANFVKYANPSGKAFLEAITRMQRYVGEYIHSLRDAREHISTREQQSQEDVAKTGEPHA